MEIYFLNIRLKKKPKKTFNKKINKENPFGILKTLNLN